MAIVHGNEYVKEILEIFGLNEQKVLALNIHMEWNEPTVLTVKRFVTTDEINELKVLLEKYDVHIKEKNHGNNGS